MTTISIRPEIRFLKLTSHQLTIHAFPGKDPEASGWEIEIIHRIIFRHEFSPGKMPQGVFIAYNSIIQNKSFDILDKMSLCT